MRLIFYTDEEMMTIENYRHILGSKYNMCIKLHAGTA